MVSAEKAGRGEARRWRTEKRHLQEKRKGEVGEKSRR